MKIGIPKEIKENEYRVGMTPAGVQTLVENKHDVFVQSDAGIGSRFSNSDYIAVGAKILGDGLPKIGAHGKPVIFLNPKDFSGTLIELEEIK